MDLSARAAVIWCRKVDVGYVPIAANPCVVRKVIRMTKNKKSKYEDAVREVAETFTPPVAVPAVISAGPELVAVGIRTTEAALLTAPKVYPPGECELVKTMTMQEFLDFHFWIKLGYRSAPLFEKAWKQAVGKWDRKAKVTFYVFKGGLA